ncbi:MAG: hypothetical protein ACRDL6_05475 [Solirubrobacterales bacterium]
MGDLLTEAVEAHGGRRRWGRAAEVSARVRSGGALLRLKGKRRSLREYGLTVSTGRQSASLEPYPGEGRSGIFDGDSVRVLAADGSVIEERTRARDAFFGLGGLRRNLRWDDLDALYFAGYAMWNYLNAPFLLEGPEFESREGEPLEAEGESWRRLDVSFPEGFHTHCREQTFYFDSTGLLRRHDYSADVVSPLANAAHFCDEHREVDGLVFPTRRTVVPKAPGGHPLPGPTVVSIELDSLAVH